MVKYKKNYIKGFVSWIEEEKGEEKKLREKNGTKIPIQKTVDNSRYRL